MTILRTRSSGFVLAIAAGLALAVSGPASAQVVGGGKPGSKGPGRGGFKEQGNVNEPLTDAGNFFGRIVKFVPIDDDEGDLIGTLSLKGYTSRNSSLRLKVYRRDELTISIGNMTVPEDQYEEVLAKGLQCDVNWEVIGPKEGKKRKKITKSTPKQLISLSFKRVEVQGKIVAIDGDIVTIRVKPRNGQQWPDVLAKENDRNRRRTGGNFAPRKAKIRSKKLKLRVIEEASSLTDLENSPIDAGDLEVDQLIEASVVSGFPKIGYLTALKLVNELVESETADDSGGIRTGDGGRGRRRTDG